jgi:hypothetical protein
VTWNRTPTSLVGRLATVLIQLTGGKPIAASMHKALDRSSGHRHRERLDRWFRQSRGQRHATVPVADEFLGRLVIAHGRGARDVGDPGRACQVRLVGLALTRRAMSRSLTLES